MFGNSCRGAEAWVDRATRVVKVWPRKQPARGRFQFADSLLLRRLRTTREHKRVQYSVQQQLAQHDQLLSSQQLVAV